MSKIYNLLFIILSPSLLVILSAVENLISLRVNSAKNLMVLRAGSMEGNNLALRYRLGNKKSAIDMFLICDIDLM